MLKFRKTLCFLCVVIELVLSEFAIPEVQLEAFKPSGFRVSIAAQPGVELFAFHGKLNKPISQIEPGEFSADVKSPKNGRFTYYNPGLRLKPGDVVHYWVFVQHEQLGYRKDDQKWAVSALSDFSGNVPTTTTVTDAPFQKPIFEDYFNGVSLDTSKWLLEQYIPASPDYEFVTYRKDADVTFIAENKLQIKPKVIQDEHELRQDVDLKNGCTRTDGPEHQCYSQFFGIFQRPVISGRLVSKTTFSYGKFEVKAKLPKGDWIYPEVYLEDVADSTKKIWIAYARGNEELKGSGGDDLGNKLLFGGPVLNPKEPERSQNLASYPSAEPLSNGVHLYAVHWNNGQITLYIDGNQYGSVYSSDFANSNTVKLVLGVGVGGTTDFPDDYVSKNGVAKPWKDNTRSQIKNFYSNKNAWLKTWSDIGRRLQVELVRVTAS